MKYTGAIFDMDGLLIDTEKISQEIWKEIAEEMNVTLAEGFIHDISGSAGEKMCRTLEKYYRVEDGESIRVQYVTRMADRLRTCEVPVKKGAKELLEAFKNAGIPVALASSSIKSQIELSLANTGLREYFEVIVSGDMIQNCKPSPDIFLKAAEKIDRDPKECCVFEDSMLGIRAGHAAGCDPYMVPDILQPTDEVRKMCVGVFESLSDVKKTIFGE